MQSFQMQMNRTLPTLKAFNDERTALSLQRLIRQMLYGDALVRRAWRLEYICPDTGFVHYRLYHRNRLVAIQFVRADHWLPEVQRKLAICLTVAGFTRPNTEWLKGGAQTPISANQHRLPKVFYTSFEKKAQQYNADCEWSDIRQMMVRLLIS